MTEGNDVTSVGINGTAVAGDGFTGIWVASVKSGSPAHGAGVEAGDVVTRLEGLLLAEDGTMSDYCDILRSHSATDPLTVEVLRFSTEEVYEGVLNGSPLALSFSFAQELQEEAPSDGGAPAYESYVDVTDDSGAISISIPDAWSDISGIPWERDGGNIGVSIVAAPDLQGWYDTWEVPGVFFGASRSLIAELDETALLDSNDFSGSCTFDSRNEYSDALYTGSYDLWVDCDGLATTMVVVAAVPEDRSFIMLLQVIAVSDADFDALDTILNTFVASGDF
jgi:serine protease Do